MLQNPIVQRELIGMMRTRKAIVIQASLVVLFALLLLLRWPVDPIADVTGVKSMQVFKLFSYGILTALIFLVPVFPATSVIRERNSGTLALLLNSPMKPTEIYFGKLTGVMMFVIQLLILSIPSLAACFVMGGISMQQQVLPLYGVLLLVALQYSTMGLMVSCLAGSIDSALKITYGLVLFMSVVVLGPHLFLQGATGSLSSIASWFRCISPLPPVMDIIGHGDVGAQGMDTNINAITNYIILSLSLTAVFILVALVQLNRRILDRSRSAGVMTHQMSKFAQRFRMILYMGMDPKKRAPLIPGYMNPVLIKEFRSRRFGRVHWMIRTMVVCVVISLFLAIQSTVYTEQWGVDIIGGIMVVLQVGLVVIITPSLASGLISSELESGTWRLLLLTPVNSRRILVGKLLSVAVTIFLIVLATLPGYVVLMVIDFTLVTQIWQVCVCLLMTCILVLAISALVSSLFRATATATAVSFSIVIMIFAGTFLFWLGKGAPFNVETVEKALVINPLATALTIMGTPGFDAAEFQLLAPQVMWKAELNELWPALQVPLEAMGIQRISLPLSWNWVITAGISFVCFVLFYVRVKLLTKPQ
ncbi:MAG: ABC transporter [Planctomycetaceae bacterium]|nr:ABC transporter [Planctomycetaceae bacterium]|tara:strand:- start:1168 stop:2937 length:1770 start_codon:yes stop_codon:yes gene_type:complete